MKLSDQEVNEIITGALKKTGFDFPVKWEWSNRMTATMGRAFYEGDRIKFSAKLFDIAPREKQINTVTHEIAHLIAKRLDPDAGHGPTWRYVMEELGYPNARACYQETDFKSRSEYQKVRNSHSSKRYFIICEDCGRENVYKRKGKVVKYFLGEWGQHYGDWIPYKCGICNGELFLDEEKSTL